MTTAPAARLRRVQVRTTAIAMATVIVVLSVGAVALVRYFEHQQVGEVDARLAATGQMVDSVTSGRISSLPSAQVASGALVQAVDANGHVVFASDRLVNRPPLVDTTTGQSGPVTVSDDGLGAIRVITIELGQNTVLYGESLQSVDDAVSGLTTALVFGVPLLALILGALIWIVVGRTLAPVRVAIEREQRLIADVSHELRTPIAGARALLESESSIPAEIELNRIEALAVLARLDALTSDLLADARAGQTGPPQLEALIDLDDVVLGVAQRVPRRPSIDLDLSGVCAGQVRGNESDLERMIANIVTNALRHARNGVRLTVAEDSATVTVIVSDDGPGIAAQDRETIFERFTRLDDARAHDGTGAGLGLPIARSIAVAHGGTIEVRDSGCGGAEFVIRLPAAVTDPSTVPAESHHRGG